jgi:hypothetical protein
VDPLIAEVAATVMDEAPVWTLDQIAGLVFFFFLIAIYLSSTLVDSFVARMQRRQLGLCEECGGVYEPSSCMQTQCPYKSGGGGGGVGNTNP